MRNVPVMADADERDKWCTITVKRLAGFGGLHGYRRIRYERVRGGFAAQFTRCVHRSLLLLLSIFSFEFRNVWSERVNEWTDSDGTIMYARLYRVRSPTGIEGTTTTWPAAKFDTCRPFDLHPCIGIVCNIRATFPGLVYRVIMYIHNTYISIFYSNKTRDGRATTLSHQPLRLKSGLFVEWSTNKTTVPLFPRWPSARFPWRTVQQDVSFEGTTERRRADKGPSFYTVRRVTRREPDRTCRSIGKTIDRDENSTTLVFFKTPCRAHRTTRVRWRNSNVRVSTARRRFWSSASTVEGP